MDAIKEFEVMDTEMLETVEGGFVLTGTAVAVGVGIFASSFGVGYAVGQSLRRK